LFLDEIGDMPTAMQAKLLRVLEQSEVERIGGDRTIAINVRVVVATHRNLEELVRKRVFREDLYHRVFCVSVDAAASARTNGRHSAADGLFCQHHQPSERLKPQVISAGAYAELQRYAWPGNIRELRNVVERLLLLADGQVDVATVRMALGADFNSSAPQANILADVCSIRWKPSSAK